jgi:hypothetical protein
MYAYYSEAGVECLTPQDGGLNAISKDHLFRDMMRSRARRKAKNFFRIVLVFIVCCVWVLFWSGVLIPITVNSGRPPEQIFLWAIFCLLWIAAVPFGFIADRLLR